MKVFTKKETPAQNLAFCAIVAGFDGILSCISALLPISSFFLMMVVPLLSSVVAYFCKKRYYVIYFFGALGVSIALSAWDFSNTIFYLLPSLCAGLAYGFLLRRKTSVVLTNFVVSMVQYCFFVLSLWLVKAIYEIDMRETLGNLFGISNKDLLNNAFPLLSLFYSFAVTGFSHLFFSLQSSHLNLEYNDPSSFRWLAPGIAFLCSGLGLGLSFVYPKLAYFFLGCSFYWGFASLLSCFPKIHLATIICLGITIFASLLGFSMAYSAFAMEQALAFFSLFPASMAISSFLDVLLGKKNKSI